GVALGSRCRQTLGKARNCGRSPGRVVHGGLRSIEQIPRAEEMVWIIRSGPPEADARIWSRRVVIDRHLPGCVSHWRAMSIAIDKIPCEGVDTSLPKQRRYTEEVRRRRPPQRRLS